MRINRIAKEVAMRFWLYEVLQGSYPIFPFPNNTSELPMTTDEYRK